MKACRSIKKLLPLFAGGELSPVQHQTVKNHIKTCPMCQEEAARYLALKTGTERLSDAPSVLSDPVDLFESVWTEISQNNPKPRKRASGRLVFAAGFAVFVLAFITLRLIPDHPFQSRKTLQSYLIEQDFEGLAEAVRHPSSREHLMAEEVSVRLLIRSLDAAQKEYRYFSLSHLLNYITDDQEINQHNMRLYQENLRALKYKKSVKITMNDLFRKMSQT